MDDFPLYAVAFLFQNAPNVFFLSAFVFVYLFIYFIFRSISLKENTFTGGLFYGIGVWTKILIKTS